MKKPTRRLTTVLVIVTIGIALGLGYVTNSNIFSEKESDIVKSQFLISDFERNENLDVAESNLSKLVNGNSEFALDLYQKIKDEKGNSFYSPYSISLALTMAYAGAEGVTEQEMADTLNFEISEEQLHEAFNYLDQALRNKNANENFTLNIANSFWGQENYQFEEEYLDILARNYGAGIRLLDFINNPEESRQTINEWVEGETEQKIKNLIPEGSITPLTRAVLTNAIYFNASWKYPFEESETEEGTFTLPNSEKIQTEMMKQVEGFKYAEGTNYKAVELPYQGSNMAMTIIKPDRSRFKEFENELNHEVLEEIVGKFETRNVTLKMPKFEYEAGLNLNKILSEMGMSTAFTAEANFSGITDDRSLAISDVLHKAFVSVDEKGTEAAAATAVILDETAIPEPAEMNLDSPFIFLIRDLDTETILFAGRVLDPNE